MGIQDRDWYWKAIDEKNKKLSQVELIKAINNIDTKKYQSKQILKAKFEQLLVWIIGLAFLGWIAYMGLQIMARILRLIN